MHIPCSASCESQSSLTENKGCSTRSKTWTLYSPPSVLLRWDMRPPQRWNSLASRLSDQKIWIGTKASGTRARRHIVILRQSLNARSEHTGIRNTGTPTYTKHLQNLQHSVINFVSLFFFFLSFLLSWKSKSNAFDWWDICYQNYLSNKRTVALPFKDHPEKRNEQTTCSKQTRSQSERRGAPHGSAQNTIHRNEADKEGRL